LFAARGGRLGEVAELLNNPALDLMYENGEFNENAHWACKKGHSAIVALLLTRDEVDINRIASKGKTALSFACEGNHAICIRLLLQDSCWKHNDNYDNWTFAFALSDGLGVVIGEWIASGKTIDIEGVRERLSETSRELRLEMKSFFEAFESHPNEMRHAVRLKIGWYDHLASDVFARIVFLSDGLLQLKKATEARPLTTRFFRIADQLPLELQMVLCYRVAGIHKMAIPKQKSEIAFKNLALIFSLTQ